MHLKHASLLLNPAKSHTGEVFTPERVKATLLAMQAGVFKEWPKGKTPSTMLAVLWNQPRFIDRDILQALPPKPPYQERIALENWHQEFGRFIAT